MPSKKISELTNVTSLNSTDEIAVVQSGETKAATIQDLISALASIGISANSDGILQLLIDNDSTGSSALARVAINSGDSSIAIFAAGSAYSGTVVTGGPTGAQGVIRTLAGQPFLVATDNEARFRISQEISLADDATGTFEVGEYGLVIVTSSFGVDCRTMVFQETTSLATVSSGGATEVGAAGSNPDVDDKINVWKSSSTVLSIKNRIGSPRGFIVTVLGNL